MGFSDTYICTYVLLMTWIPVYDTYIYTVCTYGTHAYRWTTDAFGVVVICCVKRSHHFWFPHIHYDGFLLHGFICVGGGHPSIRCDCLFTCSTTTRVHFCGSCCGGGCRSRRNHYWTSRHVVVVVHFQQQGRCQYYRDFSTGSNVFGPKGCVGLVNLGVFCKYVSLDVRFL